MMPIRKWSGDDDEEEQYAYGDGEISGTDRLWFPVINSKVNFTQRKEEMKQRLWHRSIMHKYWADL